MNKINLYDRSNIRPMLEEFGFAVELFKDWSNDVSASHGHDVLEINYVARGRASQFADDTTTELSHGTLTVVNYGLEHSIKTGSEGIDIINIYIDIARVALPRLGEHLTAILRNIIPLHPISINNLNKVVRIDIDDVTTFEQILYAIMNENATRKIGSGEAIRQYFTLFLIAICRSAQSNGFAGAAPVGRGFEKIEALLKYLEDNCHKHLSLESVAQIASLDKHYLCREFKRITGMTVFEYLLSRRLQKSMYELRTTDKKIIDISLDSGFGNVSNFNRVFKKAIKITPSQYRNGL